MGIAVSAFAKSSNLQSARQQNGQQKSGSQNSDAKSKQHVLSDPDFDSNNRLNTQRAEKLDLQQQQQQQQQQQRQQQQRSPTEQVGMSRERENLMSRQTQDEQQRDMEDEDQAKSAKQESGDDEEFEVASSSDDSDDDDLINGHQFFQAELEDSEYEELYEEYQNKVKEKQTNQSAARPGAIVPGGAVAAAAEQEDQELLQLRTRLNKFLKDAGRPIIERAEEEQIAMNEQLKTNPLQEQKESEPEQPQKKKKRRERWVLGGLQDEDEKKRDRVKLEYNTNFLNEHFQLQTLLSRNTQTLFRFRTHQPDAYAFDYREEMLRRDATKLSHFILDTNLKLNSSKEIWQGYRERSKARKFQIKIYKGDVADIEKKYETKLQLLRRLENVSSMRIVRAEELYMAQSEMFGQPAMGLLVEVRSSTMINLADIILTRQQLRPPAYFKEEEVLYLFKHLAETLHHAQRHQIYHSYLRCQSVLVFCNESNKAPPEIDPLTFSKQLLAFQQDSVKYKLKDFLFHEYDSKKRRIKLRLPPKSNDVRYYYPLDLVGNLREADEYLFMPDMHRVDLYSLGVLLLAVMTLRLPMRAVIQSEISKELQPAELQTRYSPGLLEGVRQLLLFDARGKTLTIEQVVQELQKHIDEDTLKKPKTRAFYNKALEIKLKMQEHNKKEETKAKKDRLVQRMRERRQKRGAEAQNWWNESFDRRLNEACLELLKAQTYLLFKNFKKAEAKLRDVLRERGEFIEGCFSISDYSEIYLSLTYALLKQHNFKEAQRLLKSLQIDLRKANLELSMTTLKCLYYLTLTAFLLKQHDSSDDYAKSMVDLMLDLQLTQKLDRNVIFDVYLLKGKIHSDNTDEEKIIKQIPDLEERRMSLVNYYIQQEKFRLAEYPLMSRYLTKSLHYAGIEFEIEQDWGGGGDEDEEEDSGVAGSSKNESAEVSYEQEVEDESRQMQHASYGVESAAEQEGSSSRRENQARRSMHTDSKRSSLASHGRAKFSMRLGKIPSEKVRSSANNSVMGNDDNGSAKANAAGAQAEQQWDKQKIMPWALMCFGYAVEMCDILVMSAQLQSALQRTLSLIKFMIINDIFIDWIVIWCNKFAQYIANDANFKQFGEFIVIAILKNYSKLAFRNDFVFHVIGRIFYFSGLIFDSEKYFDMSIRAAHEYEEKTIYKCLSQEWLAYIAFFEEKNQEKGRMLYKFALDEYGEIEDQFRYKRLSHERQAYISRIRKHHAGIREHKSIMKEKEIENHADRRYICATTFFEGFYLLQQERRDTAVKKIDLAINTISTLFPEAHMITVRWYLIAIADCLCLGCNDLAIKFSESCKQFIYRFHEDDEDYSDFFVLYGYIMLINRKYELALEIFTQAEKELEEECEKNPNAVQMIMRLACVSDIEGRIFALLGRYYNAYVYLTKTMQLHASISYELTESAGYRAATLADTCYKLGYHAQALQQCQSAKKIFVLTKKLAAKERMLMTIKSFEIRLEKQSFREMPSQIYKLERQTRLDREMIGLAENPDVQAVYSRVLFKMNLKLKDFEKASTEIEQSLRSLLEAYGPQEIAYYEVLLLKVLMLIEKEDLENAHKTLIEVRKGYKTVTVLNCLFEADLERLTGRLLYASGNLEESFAYFQRAHDAYQDLAGGKKHPLLAECLLYLGECLFARGGDLDLTRARTLFERSLDLYTNYYDALHANVPILLLELGKLIFVQDTHYFHLKVISHSEEIFSPEQRQFLIKRLTDRDQELQQILESMRLNIEKPIEQREDPVMHYYKIQEYMEKNFDEEEIQFAAQNVAHNIENLIEERSPKIKSSRLAPQSFASMVDFQTSSSKLQNASVTAAGTSKALNLKKTPSSPKNAIISPNLTMGSPRNAMASPQNAMVSPQNAMVSPQNAMVSPQNAMISLQNAMATPQIDEMVQRKGSLTQLKGGTTPQKHSVPRIDLQIQPISSNNSGKSPKNAPRNMHKYEASVLTNRNNTKTQSSFTGRGDADSKSQESDYYELEDYAVSVTLGYFIKDPVLLHLQHAYQIALIFYEQDSFEIFDEIKDFIKYLRKIYLIEIIEREDQSETSESALQQTSMLQAQIENSMPFNNNSKSIDEIMEMQQEYDDEDEQEGKTRQTPKIQNLRSNVKSISSHSRNSSLRNVQPGTFTPLQLKRNSSLLSHLESLNQLPEAQINNFPLSTPGSQAQKQLNFD